MPDEIDAYIQLQQQIHHALRVQHPEWVERGHPHTPALRFRRAQQTK